MNNKLLIYEQEYDVISFYNIISKDELEDYIKDWVYRYIDTAKNHLTYTYISHSIVDNEFVRIILEHSGYNTGGQKYPSDKVVVGFNYVDLDKIPIWEPKK